MLLFSNGLKLNKNQLLASNEIYQLVESDNEGEGITVHQRRSTTFAKISWDNMTTALKHWYLRHTTKSHR
jgi:hypothetical protein